MFSGFGNVVFFVELAEKLFKSGSHSVVVERRKNFLLKFVFAVGSFLACFFRGKHPLLVWAEVDFVVKEFFKHLAQEVHICEVSCVSAYFKLFENIFNVLRISVDVFLKRFEHIILVFADIQEKQSRIVEIRQIEFTCDYTSPLTFMCGLVGK